MVCGFSRETTLGNWAAFRFLSRQKKHSTIKLVEIYQRTKKWETVESWPTCIELEVKHLPLAIRCREYPPQPEVRYRTVLPTCLRSGVPFSSQAPEPASVPAKKPFKSRPQYPNTVVPPQTSCLPTWLLSNCNNGYRRRPSSAYVLQTICLTSALPDSN